jgi:hypothetical protein
MIMIRFFITGVRIPLGQALSAIWLMLTGLFVALGLDPYKRTAGFLVFRYTSIIC